MKIVVIGNCHAVGMVSCLGLMASNEILIENRKVEDTFDDLTEGDVVLLQTPFKSHLTQFEGSPAKVIIWPMIIFGGFHPDIVILPSRLFSPIGNWQSSIALAAWKLGLSVEETISLFRPDVFDSLGFFNKYERDRKALATILNETDFPGNKLVDDWCRRGCFMYGVNHPKLHVIADLAHVVMNKLGITPRIQNPAVLLHDPLQYSSVWPVYPAIVERLGLQECEMVFKATPPSIGRRPSIFNLEGFVKETFNILDRSSPEALGMPFLDRPHYKELNKKVRRASNASGGISSDSPYRTLNDFQFWRRAIEQTPAREVDPVVSAKFKLSPNQRVATAGSCFAQHISRTLKASGFDFYVPEQAPSGMSPDEAHARNYGVFSARYGNIYTARQLRQLFDRAFGAFRPVEDAWIRKDGFFVDPFRPAIESNGFSSVEELEESENTHLTCVRKMFEELDVFVFTLGLTEGWRSKIDGAVFPLAPGVAGGRMDHEKHEFVNFSAREIIEDMDVFIQKLRGVNPQAKIILTVSPVPLVATYEPRHVLLSTTYSKAALRVAAEELSACKDYVAYFPSYEIITGSFTRGAYFEDDLRSVTEEGVGHVMTLFLRHYANAKTGEYALADDVNSETAQVKSNSVEEMRKLSEVICEEKLIEG